GQQGGGQGQAQVTPGQVQTVPTYPGAVAPPPPGTPLGGGNNVYSSSQTYSGGQEDHFDMDPTKGMSASTVYGNRNGSADLGANRSGSFTVGEGGVVGNIPDAYTVKRGDTLWGICDTFFQNPYQWPRIWSYNPQIQNPHWI